MVDLTKMIKGKYYLINNGYVDYYIKFNKVYNNHVYADGSRFSHPNINNIDDWTKYPKCVNYIMSKNVHKFHEVSEFEATGKGKKTFSVKPFKILYYS